MPTLINGTEIAAAVRDELTQEVSELRTRGVHPALAVILAGDDPASHTYVRAKLRAAAALGIRSEDHVFPASVQQEELLKRLQTLNDDPAIHGILVQMPLPPHINTRAVVEALHPGKDVDGFHPANVGALVLGYATMPPCTPAGIMELLRRTGVQPAGMEAVVVGRSMLVGRPVALLLLAANATVTLCHSRTRDLAAVCRRAELLVVAIGKPRLITAEYVREGAVVIDVGVNRVEGKLVGDVDFEAVSPRAKAITPVPGGVGPMTIAMLMRNTVIAARLSAGPEVRAR
jgi:methylenetetrahydrofolate dehydrogenase (NADP+)/methenyltetrahydrofolate cyclohydrolase